MWHVYGMFTGFTRRCDEGQFGWRHHCPCGCLAVGDSDEGPGGMTTGPPRSCDAEEKLVVGDSVMMGQSMHGQEKGRCVAASLLYDLSLCLVSAYPVS